MWFCNCIKAAEAAGKGSSRRALLGKFTEDVADEPVNYALVIPTSEDTCPYCGYYAVFSHKPLHEMTRAWLGGKAKIKADFVPTKEKYKNVRKKVRELSRP